MTDLVTLAIDKDQIDRILAGEVLQLDLLDVATGKVGCVVFIRLHKEEPTGETSD